jgi:hypothetical protein
MRSIRFSHEDYEKFRRIDRKPPFRAQLIQVFLLHNADVADTFTEYDAKYYTANEDTEYFDLQSRLWIVLLFAADNGLLFTTMRPSTTSKLHYYRNSQGEEFEITVEGYNARGRYHD